MKFSDFTYLRWPLFVLIAAVVAACASMGRPEGGPRDEMPPVFVKSRPAPASLNVKTDRIIIEFDENIQVDDPLNKVVISPAQKTPAKVSGVGHRITVNLQDTLVPDATYTIDFTDAIKDLNEGNILEGFAIDFATGPVLDSLCISGMVFQASNLEPAQSMLVGVHSNLSDTALTALPFDRITRTNQLGQFTIRNLKPGSYNVFAIDDVNRDNKWDRSENIAFLGSSVTPVSSRAMHTDTIFAANGDIDSVFTHEVTEFGPADLLLTWFNENYKSQYISKNERKERHKIYFEMGAPSDTFPSLRFVGGPYDGEDFTRRTVLESSATRDSLTYWIADTTVAALDSIYLAVTYLRTDTLEQLSWTTDTLNFSMRKQKSQPQKEKKKKKNDNDTVPDTPKIQLLKVTPSITTQAEVYSPMILTFDEPLESFETAGIRMSIMEGTDTLWTPVKPPEFTRPGPNQPLKLAATYNWNPGAKYQLLADSTTFKGIYGHHSGPLKAEFTVRKLEEYGNITFTVSNLNGQPAFVELLNTQDAPVSTVRVVNGSASFKNILPGTYYARLIIDRNENGKWDTGSVADSIQPEDVFYFSKKINLKKNWDISQTWDIYELPVDQQKPNDIKKNKPKKKATDLDDEYDEEDDQYYDEFGNPAVDPDDPFGKKKGSNYNRTNRSNTLGNGLGTPRR